MKDKLKQECIERLKIMESNFGLHKNCRKEFEKDDTLYYSERTRLGGILYWVNNRDDLRKKVEEFEGQHNVKVYFCLITYTEFGELFDMLYVSNGEDDDEYWEEEKQMLKEGYVISNCRNLTDDMLSDFGEIMIKGMSGGIVRVA
jgi:hypothetical protein